jgi:hypothetical protein
MFSSDQHSHDINEWDGGENFEFDQSFNNIPSFDNKKFSPIRMIGMGTGALLVNGAETNFSEKMSYTPSIIPLHSPKNGPESCLFDAIFNENSMSIKDPIIP